MTSSKPPVGGGATVSCDYCITQTAVLFCRADSARLCLLCDQHVHSANALSKKHLRAQICDNCAADAASVRCLSDGLSLCSGCDADAHSGVYHSRRAVEGFSGCPSPFYVASSWGIAPIRRQHQEEVVDPWDLVVPTHRKEAEIMKQLTELVVNEDLVPGTPSANDHERNEDGGGSLLLMEEHMVDDEERDRDLIGCGGTKNKMGWDSNPTNQQPASQIWDFNLGTSRGHEESSPLDMGYGGSDDQEFTMKSYSELLRGASSETTKEFGDIYRTNEEGVLFSNNPKNGSPYQGPATSESNNLSKTQHSSGSVFGQPKGHSVSQEIQFSEQVIVRGESAKSGLTKADMEQLAQNRGNAMLRYKEKKKNRR